MRGSDLSEEQLKQRNIGYQLHKEMLDRIKNRNQNLVSKQDESKAPSKKKIKQFLPYTRPLVYSTNY